MHFLSLPFQMLPTPFILHHVFLLFIISKQNSIPPIGSNNSDQIVSAYEGRLVKVASGQKQPGDEGPLHIHYSRKLENCSEGPVRWSREGGGPVAGRRAPGLLINHSDARAFTGFPILCLNALSGNPGDSASPPCFFYHELLRIWNFSIRGVG